MPRLQQPKPAGRHQNGDDQGARKISSDHKVLAIHTIRNHAGQRSKQHVRKHRGGAGQTYRSCRTPVGKHQPWQRDEVECVTQVCRNGRSKSSLKSRCRSTSMMSAGRSFSRMLLTKEIASFTKACVYVPLGVCSLARSTEN